MKDITGQGGTVLDRQQCYLLLNFCERYHVHQISYSGVFEKSDVSKCKVAYNFRLDARVTSSPIRQISVIGWPSS